MNTMRPPLRPALLARCAGPTARAVPVALLLALAGCATAPPPAPNPPTAPAPTDADAARRAEFDATLRRWHGASLAELRAKLGKPTSTKRAAEGRTVYAYTRSAPADPGTGYSRFSCTVNYVVDDGTQRVLSHSIVGC